MTHVHALTITDESPVMHCTMWQAVHEVKCLVHVRSNPNEGILSHHDSYVSLSHNLNGGI